MKPLIMRLRALTLCGIAAVLTANIAPAQITRAIPGDPVRIDSGLVSGTLSADGQKDYFGIPFAAPPIRENRWREPQPVKPWTGVLTANTKKAECVQGLRSPSINHYFGDELAGEDCLYLNIWAPGKAKAGAKLPVLVWIYGGAFTGGSATSPIYDGGPLVKRGNIIYVAANYRLGIFGFLAHPELTKESGHNASGNWGFLDQVMALKWVQKNIAAFGGDPADVTLIGQSAGSMSINDLQASPLAKGLFKRAIGFSGSSLKGAAGAGGSLADAEAQGLKLQAAMKATDIAQMRSYSSDKVVEIARTAGVRASPDIDGYFLPDTPDNIFKAGKQNDVALYIGSMANDIGTNVPIRKATTVEEYDTLAKQMYGDNAAEFLKLYPVSDDADVKRQADLVGRSSGFGLDAHRWAMAQNATGKEPVYLYLVSRVQPFTPGVKFSDFNPATAGAYHFGDVPYWLGTYDAFNLFRRTRDWTAWDRELSAKMMDTVLAFAKTGNPSTATVKFTRFTPSDQTLVDFGNTITVEKLNSQGIEFLTNTPVIRQAGGRGGRGGGPRGGPGGPPGSTPPVSGGRPNPPGTTY